jgi:hypothetical protein
MLGNPTVARRGAARVKNNYAAIPAGFDGDEGVKRAALIELGVKHSTISGFV